MRWTMSVYLLSTILWVSGCASQQSAQGVTQLESEMAGLQQRVGELEDARSPEAASAPADFTLKPAAPQTTGTGIVQPTPGTSAYAKPSVKEIQQALKTAGFYLAEIDGKMGSQTREAIRTFQEVHGLQVDGRVGKLTWAELQGYLDSDLELEEPSVATYTK